MTETEQIVEETLQKICFKLFCKNCKSIAVDYPLDVEDQEIIKRELDQAIATATQQAVEEERKRILTGITEFTHEHLSKSKNYTTYLAAVSMFERIIYEDIKIELSDILRGEALSKKGSG